MPAWATSHSIVPYVIVAHVIVAGRANFGACGFRLGGGLLLLVAAAAVADFGGSDVPNAAGPSRKAAAREGVGAKTSCRAFANHYTQGFAEPRQDVSERMPHGTCM
jgi:hypothetical protein